MLYHLRFFTTDGSLDFNLISLFPPTHKNRLNGYDTPYCWRWNEITGPLKDRPGRPRTWSYQNTDGSRKLSEIAPATLRSLSPTVSVFSGATCPISTKLSLLTFSNPRHMDRLQPLRPLHLQHFTTPYIQDTLNELEFILGPTAFTYGALSAPLRYPEPRSVKYVEVGNEYNLKDRGDSYQSYRFEAFYNAIKVVCPNMNAIASTVAFGFGKEVGRGFHEYTRPDSFVGRFGYFVHFKTGFETLASQYAVVQLNIPAGGDVGWN
ncbi:glycoside hydrolase family 51 protein [Lepidopterella palustris CBS 459.81]|uniref:Glycoside hydrolase family 51 protein n=1 Tax=Lepidopterella palustris CBS 459.81 TaxID=1314670 RepID=A0A8E2EAY5_9PEZI|nr:glycoside hydrolase family 51 protein [Lepidopterella palustris CBS 459.81]